MKLKDYVLPNRRNLKVTLILLLIFLFFWWLSAKMIVLDAPNESITFSFILIPLGFVFLMIYPIPGYISAIIHLYTLQFLGALVAEIIYLYIISNVILAIKDKIKKR